MGKFDGVLFCTDLDGTLLNSQRQVSAENRAAIEYFKSEGGSFTIITGRPPCLSSEIYEASGANIPYGCINGGAIYDPAAGKYLWADALPEEAKDIIRYVERNMPDIGIQVNYPDRICFCRANSSTDHFCEITGYPYIFKDIKDLGEEPIYKVIFSTDDEARLAEIRAEISALPQAEQVSFISGARDLCEMLSKGNTKGTALCKLAELLGFDMKKTVAVGDFENDIDMIKKAGIGYAVANADPRAKAVADRITVSNNDHAIARIIEELGDSITV